MLITFLQYGILWVLAWACVRVAIGASRALYDIEKFYISSISIDDRWQTRALVSSLSLLLAAVAYGVAAFYGAVIGVAAALVGV